MVGIREKKSSHTQLIIVELLIVDVSEVLTYGREARRTDHDKSLMDHRESLLIRRTIGRDIDRLPFFEELLQMREYGRWFEIAKIRDIIKGLADLEELIGLKMCGDFFSLLGLDAQIELLCHSTKTPDCGIDFGFSLIICDLSESCLGPL